MESLVGFMILPTACINRAALPSGLSLPDFMASLESEREEEMNPTMRGERARGVPEVRQQVT